MVLSGYKGDERFTVTESNEADFFAFQEFFDDEVGAELLDGGFGLGVIEGDDDAFASGETVGFDDDRKREFLQGGKGVGKSSDLFGLGGGNSSAGEEFLGEDFRAFETSGSLGRANNSQAAGAEFVDDAGHEGGFGTDDGEIDGQGLGEVGEGADGLGRR